MDIHGDIVVNILCEKFKAKIKAITPSKRLCVAYSGGVDSHVLLDLVVRAFAEEPEYQISALHIHHGIHLEADQWVQHCEHICTKLRLPLTVLWVNGKVKDGRSPEEVAREARFAAFEQFLQEGECLLLAHHEADQTETILLRLFRGSGPLGLAGMREKVELGKGELIRPLLEATKEDILRYAQLRQLEWIEDHSNTNSRFDRNFLRNEVLPLLKARWPRVVRSVNRAGALCFETATAIQVLALSDLEAMRGSKEDTLSVSRLLQLEPVRRRWVLRCWLQQLGYALPSWDHMERIDREVLKAKPGSRPRLKISYYEIRRLRDELSVGPV